MRRALLVAVPLAVIAGVVTLLVEPNLIIGLRSPRALAWLVGVAVVCGVVGLLARRLGASPTVAIAAAVVPGLLVTGLVVLRPILDPREISEALPTAAPASPAPAAGSSSGTPVVATPAAAASPARVATGALRGLAGHSASGHVSTYRLADGSHVVRFEGVDIGGTPDPEVYVLSGRDRTGKRGGTHLGALKGEKGSFNYFLPAALAGTDFTVVVWCEQFAVDIAHATQA